MNKLLKSLTIAALAVSANVCAHTEHTYLQVRPQGVNLPLEYTTFNERMTAKLENRFGGNFMVSGFYGQSTEKSDLGKFFGINNKHEFVLNNLDSGDFRLSNVLRTHAGTDETATVEFGPKETTWGVRFDYYQNLDKLVKGLYFKVNLPIVGVKRDMGLEVEGTSSDALKTDLRNYFKGEYVGSEELAQTALQYAHIDGSHNETGVADIEITLGYKFLYKSKHHLALNLAIIIPTGNDGEGKHLFEPIYGAGKHFGFGGGLDAQARLWGDSDQNIKLNLVANYRYLFESSEDRLYRIKTVHFPYINLVKEGVHTPAPNIFTLNSDVTPGSMIDAILALAYNKGGFCFDLGYNLYYRDETEVHVKGDIEADWMVVGTETVLTKDMLDSQSAETPAQFTNSVYGGLGYAFKEWDYPLLFGIGGKYEFASKNSAIEQWQIWGKLSLSF